MGMWAQGKYLAAALAATLLATAGARAQSVADFYRGKTVHMVIGYGPGGGYDIYGRLAAQFLGRHLPGHPTIIAENMPGASSLRAVEYLANAAPKDGTYLGSVQQALAMTALIKGHLKFDPAKMPYIGRLVSNIDVAVALPKTGIKSFADLLKRQVTVGTDQSGSMSFAYARLLDAYAGAKLEIVTGYSGSNEIALAAERGEIDVNGSYSLPAILLSHPDWVADKKAVILYQNALERYAEIPETPTLLELVKGAEGKTIARVLAGTAEIGRSILTTPGVPADRLAALRTAFRSMVEDKEFIATCASRHLMLDPGTGQAMDAITGETTKLPPATVAALRKLLKP